MNFFLIQIVLNEHNFMLPEISVPTKFLLTWGFFLSGSRDSCIKEL